MLSKSYLDFSDNLWSAWVKEELRVPRWFAKKFQLDHAPEPYLCFGDASNPLYVLTTNPGRGMEHQQRDVVLSGKPLLNPKMSYSKVSTALADFYERKLPGPAQTRIKAMRHLQELLHKDGVVQLETIPFHSARLPSKRTLPRLVENTPVLAQYSQLLADALREVSVIALSAVSTRRSISVSSLEQSEWLCWQAKLMGVDVRALKMEPLVTNKKGWTTCAVLYQELGNRRNGFILMMGSNNFPARRGLEILARTLSNDV